MQIYASLYAKEKKITKKSVSTSFPR